MTLDRPLRIVLAVLVLLGLLLALVAVLYLTDAALDVWQRLRESPSWLMFAWLGLIGALSLLAGWAVLKLLVPPRRAPAADDSFDEDSLRASIAESEALGIDVSAAQRELELLQARRETGEVRVAVFGEISTGKSTVIRALLGTGEMDTDISVRGGSTRSITDYRWTSPAGDRLILTDVPGLHEAGGTLDKQSRDEAMRAHAVVFVCDNDLTRQQYDAVAALAQFDKPMIVALNKSDRLEPEELQMILGRVTAHLATLSDQSVEVVAISAAPREAIVRRLPDGREEKAMREGDPQVGQLRNQLQSIMDRDAVLMEEMRDASVFVLARRQLDAAQADYRTRRGEELVTSYTRKAVVGALAAVAPGTDVLIQGYLGANFVRELCELYGVSARDIDVQQFLKLSQTHIGRAMPLMLAIGGNALKAFPGAGTVAGGLMHAVAYGLIFDALGRALTHSLNESGRLRPAPAASQFRKLLGENLEKRSARVAQLALDASRRRESD